MNTGDFYEILCVQPDATPEVIRNAYRQLARTYHPDVNKSPDAEERMRQINEAYAVLNDPEKRRQYDRARKAPEPTPVQWERKPPRTPQQRSHDPRYGQSRPGPVQPQPRTWGAGIVFAAAFAIIILMMFLLVLVGSPEVPGNAAELPTIAPTPTPVVNLTMPSIRVEETFETWKRDGDLFREENRNGDALAAYDRALALRPNASELWVAEGDIYSRMGYFTNALACYDRAMAVNTSAGEAIRNRSQVLTNLDIRMERAELLVEQGDYAEAIGIYDTILSAGILNDPLQKRILSAKLYALMRAGRTADAAAVSEEIEALS